MLKCPFCGFGNEDGALFCEQCKSDLSAVPVEAEAAPPMAAMVDDTIPVAAPAEALPAEAIPIAHAMPADDTIPMAEPAPAATPAPPVAEPIPPVAPAAVPAAAAVAAATPVAPPAGAPTVSVQPGASPKLVVIRGQKINVEFTIYPEHNYIGRADEKPVDIDLDDQEPPDKVWSSRQHAVIIYEADAGIITIEDLNSANGTFVNRTRIHPGQKRQLFVNDVIQIGNVHMKLKV